MHEEKIREIVASCYMQGMSELLLVRVIGINLDY